MASRREEVVTLGAIRKRGKQYAIRYYDATGKRRWETIGPNLQEARQVLADRMWERRNGKFRLSRPKITVAAFVTKWQEDYLAVQQQLGRLKPSTASSYQSNLAKHILPFFGAMPLRDVTLKTIGNVILILKQMFKHAVQWGHLDSNPVQYIELPRGEDKEMDILTPAEIRRLLEAQEEPLKTLLLTATLTGMRQGELFGLQWGDIDFDGHRIHVRRSLWHGELGTPKSRRSRRVIDMAPTLEAALHRLSAERHSDFVFCSRDGTPMDADNFRHRDFPRALRRAGLRHVRFHDLRHTYTSLLIAQGAHPKYIQVQLGHASIQTTLDRYGHLMPEIHQAEARKLDRLVFGDASVPQPRDLAVVGIGRPVEREQNGSRKHEGASDLHR